MKSLTALFSCMLLGCNAVLANISGFDDFSDGEISWQWDEPFYMGNPDLVETNDHLHFHTLDDPGTDAYRALLPWKVLRPFTQDWEVQVSTVIPDFALSAGQEQACGLTLSPNEIGEVVSNRLTHTIAKNQDDEKKYYQNLAVNGVEILNYDADRTSDTALLRMQWVAATSNLYSDISTDGGTTWTSYWPEITNPFNMTGSDEFVCMVYGASEGRPITISDNLYLDDFQTTIYTGNPPLAGSDDFNDNIRDPAKWLVPFDDALSETNSRVEYNTPGINEDDSSMWLWMPNAGSCTQDWYVAIEAYNSSTPTNHDQNATFELGVFKDWEKSFWVGLAAYGSESETDLYIDTGWNIGDDDFEALLPIDSSSATLRISYDSATKTLTSHYDFGSGFVVATNFNTGNWGLVDSDSLGVWIVGFSDKLTITSGQIYGDNFNALTRQGNPTITNCYQVSTGFKLEWVPVNGWCSVVEWTTNLIDSPFANLSAILPYPANSYTDTAHAVENECFYKVNIRME